MVEAGRTEVVAEPLRQAVLVTQADAPREVAERVANVRRTQAALEVPIALCWVGLGVRARHRCGAGRHDHGSVGRVFRYGLGHAGLVVSPVGHETGKRLPNLVQQGADVLLPVKPSPDVTPQVWAARTEDWVYPMHCHAEMSQTAAGGVYPGGLVADWVLAGGTPPTGAP